MPRRASFMLWRHVAASRLGVGGNRTRVGDHAVDRRRQVQDGHAGEHLSLRAADQAELQGLVVVRRVVQRDLSFVGRLVVHREGQGRVRTRPADALGRAGRRVEIGRVDPVFGEAETVRDGDAGDVGPVGGAGG